MHEPNDTGGESRLLAPGRTPTINKSKVLSTSSNLANDCWGQLDYRDR